MQDSEYDNVVWDTKVAGDHEASGSSGVAGRGGGGADESDGHSSGNGKAGFDVAYGGDAMAAAGRSSFGVGESSRTVQHADEPMPDVETEVTVDQPRKEGEGTNNPYVTYLVTTTRTNKATREIRRYALRRRFQDFVWMQEQLKQQFPACVIPPLPGKHRLEYLTGDRFGEDFVGKRKHGLERFLSRVLLHPSLRASHHVTVFLEAKDWSSEYEVKKPKSEGSGV
ncbi:intercellular trafficking and secretion, partial [Coemansia sp. RSA 2702]